MRLRYYASVALEETPDDLFERCDDTSDVFEAAFANYPREDDMQMVVAWGTTGDEKGEPGAVLVITNDHIVTGYVDMVPGEEDALELEGWEGDDEPWPNHQEPTVEQRLAKMIAFYRRKTRAPYIVVHDADETAEWLKQGFVRATPPEAIAADDAIEVLIWGELPIDIDVFLKRHGLSWSREQHRVGTKYRHAAPPSFYLHVPMA